MLTENHIKEGPPEARLAPPDAGLAAPDARLAAPDAGLAPPNAGLAPPNAGLAPPNAGLAPLHAGLAAPDAGLASPDAHLAPGGARPGVDRVRARVMRRGFELLDATAKTLRSPKESSERTFTGEILKLYRESDDERTAILRFVEEGRWIQAKLHLGIEEYMIACDVHRDGKLVTLKGRLERVSSKQWSVFGIGDFGTVAESTDIEKRRIVTGVMDR
jgi:hypothetical protein